MARPNKLSDAEVETGLGGLSGWSLAEGKLHKEFHFADFVAAFGFMASAALMAEKLDHHPEWCNVYNRVVVDLSTHDAGGITSLDFDLAARFDSAAKLDAAAG